MNTLESLEINCKECLQKSKCFNTLLPDELEFINLNKKQIVFQKGETVCKQGAFANYVMYVTNGLVKTYLESVNEKVINLKIIQESEFIGFSSICGTKNYNYSAVALSKAHVCLLDNKGFKELLLNNGNFAVELMRLYCSNEAHIYQKLNSIGHKYMPGRLADVILYLCDDRFKENNIFDHIKRKDIADFACISKESTIKLLMEFSAEGLIKLDGRKIKILDLSGLIKISSNG